MREMIFVKMYSDNIPRNKRSVKYTATHSENSQHACRSSLPSRRECRLSIYGRADLIITDYLFALLQPITRKRGVRMSITSFFFFFTLYRSRDYRDFDVRLSLPGEKDGRVLDRSRYMHSVGILYVFSRF